MTAAELAAVCERHGVITTANQTYVSSIRWSAWHKDDVNTVYSAEHLDAAVCALLKAQWGIKTGWYEHLDGNRRWVTQCDALMDQNEYRSEIAAVVALADRLAQGGA